MVGSDAVSSTSELPLKFSIREESCESLLSVSAQEDEDLLFNNSPNESLGPKIVSEQRKSFQSGSLSAAGESDGVSCASLSFPRPLDRESSDGVSDGVSAGVSSDGVSCASLSFPRPLDRESSDGVSDGVLASVTDEVCQDRTGFGGSVIGRSSDGVSAGVSSDGVSDGVSAGESSDGVSDGVSAGESSDGVSDGVSAGVSSDEVLSDGAGVGSGVEVAVGVGFEVCSGEGDGVGESAGGAAGGVLSGLPGAAESEISLAATVIGEPATIAMARSIEPPRATTLLTLRFNPFSG